MTTPDYSSFKRNEHGLLPGVTYVYNPDGGINYKAMVDPKYLVIQRGKEKDVFDKHGESPDLRLVDDKALMILLGGIKDLARIRGINSCTQKVDISTPEIATVTCTIEFVGNYETDGQSVTFSDVGSAGLNNTMGFGQLYLAAIAANRAFVRTVRNFLGINIVAQDELKAGDTPDETPSSSGDRPDGYRILQAKVEDKNAKLKPGVAKLTFEDIKKGACTKYRTDITLSDPEKWTDWKDIPPLDAWALLGKLKE